MFAFYITCGVNEYFPNEEISIMYVYFGYFLLAICLICFYYACAVDPGTITKKNLQAMKNKYPKNNPLEDLTECSTCKIPK